MAKLRLIAPALLSVLSATPAQSQLASATARAAGSTTAERVIRERRESSNDAIARHDTAGIARILDENVIVVTSNSAKVAGRNANVTRFAEQFQTRPDVVYRRTPMEIEVFAQWAMASERGTWTGSWTDTDGKIEIGGSYFAKWRQVNGSWRVESETYVPVRCIGGKYCSTSP